LIVATQFGLFQRSISDKEWRSIPTPANELRFVDLFIRKDTLMILSRDYIMKSADLKHFDTVILPAPVGYERSAGLFNTLWELHSSHWAARH